MSWCHCQSILPTTLWDNLLEFPKIADPELCQYAGISGSTGFGRRWPRLEFLKVCLANSVNLDAVRFWLRIKITPFFYRFCFNSAVCLGLKFRRLRPEKIYLPSLEFWDFSILIFELIAFRIHPNHFLNLTVAIIWIKYYLQDI